MPDSQGDYVDGHHILNMSVAIRRARSRLDAMCYSVGVRACEKGEQWQRALALLSEMGETKLEPNAISPTWPAEARAGRGFSQVC